MNPPSALPQGSEPGWSELRGASVSRQGSEVLGAWLAFVLPLSVALWNASPAPSWRDDPAALRVLGFAPGLQGIVSTALGQLTLLLPVGSRLLRASLVGGLALGLAGFVVFRITHRMLGASARTPRLNAALSLTGAFGTVSCVAWLEEATVVGGSVVAAALALVAFWVLTASRSPHEGADVRRTLVGGALVALTFLENVWAGASAVVLVVAAGWAHGAQPSRRATLGFAGGFVGVAVLALLPSLLRPLAPSEGARSHAELIGIGPGGNGLREVAASAVEKADRPAVAGAEASRGGDTASAAGPVPEDLLGPLGAPLATHLSELGALFCLAGLFGLVFALASRRHRAAALPWVLPIAVDLAWPRGEALGLAAEARTALHLVALVGIAPLAMLAIQSFAVFAHRLGLFAARPIAVLTVVLTTTSVLAGAEDSTQLLDQKSDHGAQAWTDEVLSSLPSRSLVVVRTEPVAWRLWAATSSGVRPDLVVVPMPLLGRGSVAARLLEVEPELALLVRELSVSGLPSEQALTVLSDARPLFVEVDPEWDHRLLEHMTPGPFLARFAPHALGRSDRREALGKSRVPFVRVLDVARRGIRPDRATLTVLDRGGRDQVELLRALGDKKEAAAMEQQLAEVGEALGVPSQEDTTKLAPVAVR